ncbi:DMT family transporter [Luteolibacter luteus]|nr:DMT family transporter [Luteolibacter luteus]
MSPEPVVAPLRKPLDAYSSISMVVLCLLWGLQQVAIKACAIQMSPTVQVSLRSLLAAFLVTGMMLLRRESLSLRDGTFRPGVLVGLLFGAEFLAVSVGLNYTTAGHMTVFLYTAPIFTVLGFHWLVREERMNRAQWLGVAISFAGIVMAFSGSLFVPGGRNLLIGDAFGTLGGILWAATTLVIRGSRLSEAPATKTLLYQLIGAAVLGLPFAWFTGRMDHITWGPMLWGNLVFQTLVVAFASYLFWFFLLTKYLASRLSVFSFLTPLFGVTFGVLLLNEPLDWRFVLGAVLVLAGIMVVNRK